MSLTKNLDSIRQQLITKFHHLKETQSLLKTDRRNTISQLSLKKSRDVSFIKDHKRCLSQFPIDLNQLKKLSSMSQSSLKERGKNKAPSSMCSELNSPVNREEGPPTGRQEIMNLRKWFLLATKTHLSTSDDNKYIENAQAILNLTCKELIRQVSVQCTHRGDLLKRVLNLHRSMFEKQKEIFDKNSKDSNMHNTKRLIRLKETLKEKEKYFEEERNKLVHEIDSLKDRIEKYSVDKKKLKKALNEQHNKHVEEEMVWRTRYNRNMRRQNTVKSQHKIVSELKCKEDSFQDSPDTHIHQSWSKLDYISFFQSKDDLLEEKEYSNKGVCAFLDITNKSMQADIFDFADKSIQVGHRLRSRSSYNTPRKLLRTNSMQICCTGKHQEPLFEAFPIKIYRPALVIKNVSRIDIFEGNSRVYEYSRDEIQLPKVKVTNYSSKLTKKHLKKPNNEAMKTRTMPKKLVNKLILQIYTVAIQKMKNSEKINSLSDIAYEEFAKKYSLKNVAERKSKEFLSTLISTSDNIQSRVFLKLLSYAEKIGLESYKNKTLLFYLKGLDIIQNSKIGIFTKSDDNENNHLCTVNRAIEFIKDSSEFAMREDVQAVVSLVERKAVADPKKINSGGLIPVDFVLECMCDLFDKSIN